MKKLFALVLVLAMALAIAVPAMASGWDDITPAPAPTSNIKIELIPLKTEQNTSVLGSLYEQLTLAYPVVEGTPVHFMVKLTIPANLDVNEAALLAKTPLVYTLGLKNLDIDHSKDSVVIGKAVNYTTGVTINDTAPYLKQPATLNFGASDVNTVFTLEYWAKGKAKAEAKATATIGFYNEWNAATPNVFTYLDKTGKTVMTVIHNGNQFGINVGTNYLLYTVTAAGKVDDTVPVKFGYGGDEYYIVRPTTNTIGFRLGDVNTVSGTEYEKMKKAFDGILAALGFGYDEAKYITEDHFTKYFGTIMEGSSSYVWPQGAVITDPNAPKPPQTGDATTVVGFVMIALALVAAAAVTVKKVRA